MLGSSDEGVRLAGNGMHNSGLKSDKASRNLTLAEALLLFDELKSYPNLEDIYIEPPDVAVVSDEDLADDEVRHR
ncbi:hypothetical protein AVEN_272298-1 [Araneus ventricosus]|uniref:Uncharacterized protein n=1 Tax=Araneus ventricosus TaxID=182803 RepID=A0A4Y2P2M7_ARAVE|nr:hypothetical protein AVEN_272298-1 [Araneus ventricosus]